MIQITKPATIPTKLIGAGAAATLINCNAFDADSAAFLTSLKIDAKIYGGTMIKRKLKAAQFNKCCFCEKDQVDEYGAVEHYRPKKGYKISRKDKKTIKPGYYWLAYDWSNLFFVCGACNTSFKGVLFPLKDETRRAKSHHEDVNLEMPLLLNPVGPKDPRDHIYFQRNLVTFKSEFGRATIEICGLDRAALNEKRNKLIEDIDVRLCILAKKNQFSVDQVRAASQYIKDCQKLNAEFSATAADYLDTFNISIT